MIIRHERSDDWEAIARLTREAFHGARHSNSHESDIVAELRATGGLTLSLIAEDAGALFGHVAFSTVRIGELDLGWFGLGPVSVVPTRQRRGTGSALIKQGVDELKRLGACGCVVLGDPAYYARLGFRHDPRLTYANFGAYFQALTLKGDTPAGEVTYAPAFD